MSRFIKKLRQISESTAPRLGFKKAATSPHRQMLIIATLSQDNAELETQLKETEVDAILIHSNNLEKGAKTIQRIAGSVGDIPWGVWLDEVTEKGAKELREMGGDFIIFIAPKAPVALLEEEIGKVIKIDLSCDDGLVETIDQLPIDAVLLDLMEDGENLTISQLMNCQWLAGLISKPLLVAVQQELTDKEIRGLWEAGANGVVVEVKEKTQLAKLCQVIKSFPLARRKPGEEKRVTLPRIEQEADSVMPEEI